MKRIAVSMVMVMMLATVFIGFSGYAEAATAPQGAVTVTGVAWFGTNSTQQAVPGMNEVPLFLTFVNGVTLTNFTISMNLSAYSPGVFSYSYIMGKNAQVQEVYNIPLLTAGSTTTIEQTVNISSSAPTGIYAENLTYSYGNSTTTFYGNVTFNLPLMGSVSVVSPDAYFGTGSNPLVGTPGMNNVPVTVVLENTGTSAATNVTVSYTPGGYLSGISQSTVLSALPAYQAIPVTFMVSISGNAQINTNYGQNLTVSYYGSSHSVHFNVPITGSSNISVVNYFTNPPVVFQDQKFISLTLVTENSGSSFARNVSISLTSNRFDVLTNPYNLSYYPSGQILNFTFLVNALNYTGVSIINAHIGSTTRAIAINLKSYGSFGISSSIPDLHTGASKQVLSFNITNTGNVALYDFSMYLLSPSVVTLHIPSSNPLAALTDANVTFAEIKPGQTVTATFLVDTSSSASFATYPAQLAISWRLNDSTGQFYSTYNFNEKVAPTGIQNLQGMLTFTPLNIAVLVLIIALVIGLVVLAGRGRRFRREAEGLKKAERREEYKQLPHKDANGSDIVSNMVGKAEEENRRGR